MASAIFSLTFNSLGLMGGMSLAIGREDHLTGGVMRGLIRPCSL